MKKLSLSLIGALLVTVRLAHADVTLNSVRVGAEDTPALAAFYAAAFGMHEYNRLTLQSGPEIFMNFGPDAAAARANAAAPLVIMPRASDAIEDPIPHVIFNVTDIAATVAALKAAGGTMPREPFAFGNSGMMIGIAADPAGNLIELIQPAR